MSDDGIRFIKVGELYAPGVDFGGMDRFELRYSNGQVMLQILVPSPSPTSVLAFQAGQVYLGLYERGLTIFFLFKLDGLYDWSDQAFSIQLLPRDQQQVPASAPGLRHLMSFVLIDSVSGVVRGVRVATWSPHFTEMFFRFVQRQLAQGLTAEQHQANITLTYAQFANSKALARAALIRERAGSQSS